MSREKSREVLMQLLFQSEAQGDFSGKVKDLYLSQFKKGEVQKDYINDLFNKISSNLDIIDFSVEKASENWLTSRMSRIDLAILRLAAGEILFRDDIPEPVSINEAVDLAKKFGTDSSYKFVNGILGRLVRQHNE